MRCRSRIDGTHRYAGESVGAVVESVNDVLLVVEVRIPCLVGSLGKRGIEFGIELVHRKGIGQRTDARHLRWAVAVGRYLRLAAVLGKLDEWQNRIDTLRAVGMAEFLGFGGRELGGQLDPVRN